MPLLTRIVDYRCGRHTRPARPYDHRRMWNLRHFMSEAVRKRNLHEEWMRFSSTPTSKEPFPGTPEYERAELNRLRKTPGSRF